jgi:hypothetical protein
VDQDVGTRLERAPGLMTSLGVDANGKPMPVCGTDHLMQCRVIEQRAPAVQHEFDNVVSLRNGFIDRSHAVLGSR